VDKPGGAAAGWAPALFPRFGMLAGKLQICIVLEGGRAGSGIRRSGSTHERSRRKEGRVLGTPANNLQCSIVFGCRRAGFGMVDSWSAP